MIDFRIFSLSDKPITQLLCVVFCLLCSRTVTLLPSSSISILFLISCLSLFYFITLLFNVSCLANSLFHMLGLLRSIVVFFFTDTSRSYSSLLFSYPCWCRHRRRRFCYHSIRPPSSPFSPPPTSSSTSSSFSS